MQGVEMKLLKAVVYGSNVHYVITNYQRMIVDIG